MKNIPAKRAVGEARTRDPQLGKLMLYQLSYYRSLGSPSWGFSGAKVVRSFYYYNSRTGSSSRTMPTCSDETPRGDAI